MMSKVKRVEKQVWDLEEFDVTLRHPDGRDVRGDLQGLPSYRFNEKKAKRTMTVAAWKELRFRRHYPGFDVDVLLGDGTAADGKMHLGNVRDSYFEDDELTEDSEVESED